MAILVNCPACRHVRQVQDRDVCLGVMCPYCHNAYMDALDRPRSDSQGLRPSLSSSSYEVDVGPWFGYAVAHWSSIVGPAIGFLLIQGFVILMIQALGFIPYVGSLLSFLVALVLVPPLEAGMIIVCLAQLKGDRWHFGDFFVGFGNRWLWPLLTFNGVMVFLFAVILLPVWAFFAVGAWTRELNPVLFGFALLTLFGPLAVYVGLRIAFFGPYLIIDRDFGPVEAIQESWDLTTGHFWGLLGVALLLTGILLAGSLTFGVGLLLALPLTGLVRAASYLLAGGTRPPMKQPEIS